MIVKRRNRDKIELAKLLLKMDEEDLATSLGFANVAAYANDVAGYAQTCRMLGACDLRSGLPSIKVPTAIVVGDEDYATPPAMAEAMHAAIAGSTLTVLPGARHLTPLERPDQVAAELDKLSRRARAMT